MLELKNIHKDYPAGGDTVHALKGINLQFRESEFVSILGPSGCGKTTMLNIIGGLDGYTDGDLVIDGRSTKDFICISMLLTLFAGFIPSRSAAKKDPVVALRSE